MRWLRFVSLPGAVHLAIGIGMLVAWFQHPKLLMDLQLLEKNFYLGVAWVSVAIGIGLILNKIWSEAGWVGVPTWNRYRASIPREGISYLAIMVVLFVGSLLGHNNMLMLVFALMAGPFVVNGQVTFGSLAASTLTRRIPKRVMAGEPFSVEMTLENRRPVISLWMMQARDQIQHPQERLQGSVLFSHVSPRSSQSAHYQLQLAYRGRYSFGPMTLSCRFPLGLVERSKIFAEPCELLVYPRIGQLTSYAKRQQLGAMELVAQPRLRVGIFADEFHRLREYRPGDNPRAIHWRTSARRQELMVREFQQSREHSLAIIVDLWSSDSTNADQQKFVEDALSLVATLCWDQVRNCRESTLKVALAGRESFRLECPASPAGLEIILDHLAVAEAGPADEFEDLLTRIVGEATAATRLLCVTTRPVEDLGNIPPRIDVMPISETPISWWLSFPEKPAGI